MARATDPAAVAAPESPPVSPSVRALGAPAGAPVPVTPDTIREGLQNKFVCPFCGSINETEQGVCPRCTMENTAASRKATKVRIGPWYVLQTRNPAAPGMKFETLVSFAKKGRVKPQSVVRGPTTHQLWRFAAQVKGLSREFGVCYSCGGPVSATASLCPQCNRLQDPPPNPDVLLESSKEATAPPGAAAAAPAVATPAGSAGGRPKEPSLDAADADFVVPALGGGAGGMGDSLAGFSMNDSIAGMTIDQPWARIELPGRGGGGGAGTRPGPGRGPAGGRPSPAREPREPVEPRGPRAGREPGDAAGAGFVPPARPAPPAAATNGKKRDGNEGFLSARDLAAAFKLELSGEADDATPRAPRQPYVPPAEAPEIDPDVLFNTPRPRRRRKGGLLKVLAVLLLLAAAGYGMAYLLSETVRQRSHEWFGRAKTALLEGESSDATKPGTPATASAAPIGPATARTPRTTPSTVGPATAPAAPPAAMKIEPAPPTTTPTIDPAVAGGPTSRPAATVAADATHSAGHVAARPEFVAAATPAGTQWEKVDKPDRSGRPAPAAGPSTLPADRARPSHPVPEKLVTPPPDTAANEAAAWKLYIQAIDAEARNEWADAANRYKAIRAFPKEAWPGDLDKRQSFAEQQASRQR